MLFYHSEHSRLLFLWDCAPQKHILEINQMNYTEQKYNKSKKRWSVLPNTHKHGRGDKVCNRLLKKSSGSVTGDEIIFPLNKLRGSKWIDILFTKRGAVYLAGEAVWRRTLWYYQRYGIMKSMKVSASPGGCDLCQPLVPQEGNTWACLHNGGGFVGVLKWHFSVVLGEHRAGNSSWMTHCYSTPWHGLHSASTFVVIAAIYSDLWLISPPPLSSSFFSLPLPLPSLLYFFYFSPTPPPTSTVYHLLRRPQAGDDLRLLADGLAGELLQYCHDHQAGGSGQGRYPLFSLCPLTSPATNEDGWRKCISGAGLYHSLYISERSTPRCAVGGNGCMGLIVTDHLLLWWLCSKVKALMYMKAHEGTLCLQIH